jgi:HSP20 family protein
MNFNSLIPWREKSQALASRDDAADPFIAFRREVDRMFDDFFNGFGGRSLRPLAGWQHSFAPSVDVAETDKEVVIKAEMPGLDEKDFEVSLIGDLLTLKGEKKAEHEQKNGDAYYMERRFGSFARSIRLPFEVKDENVEARYDKGILTVRLPKPADIQKAVRRIEVKKA